MMEELTDALAFVIEKHLPRSARELGWPAMGTEGEPSTSDWARTNADDSLPPEAEDKGGSPAFFRTQVHIAAGGETGPKITRHSQSHARLMLWASEQGERWFDASFDAEPLERLTRGLSEAQNALKDLSFSTERGVSWPLLVNARLNSGGLTAGSGKAADTIRLLQQSTKRISDDVRKRSRPGRGRNWRAAAVADACRSVWAIEKWVENRGQSTAAINSALAEKDGNRSAEWKQYLETSAPSFEKNGAPGPFGRFLEDIIRTLEILGKSGEPVSAAHALRACFQARTQFPRK